MDGSGSGKSASYSIPNAYQMLGSYIFTDPKGELYDKTAGYLKKNGYDIKVLNLVNPANSDGYNPLMHIASEIDVDVIANTIVKGQQGEGSKADPRETVRNVIWVVFGDEKINPKGGKVINITGEQLRRLYQSFIQDKDDRSR